MNCQPIGIVKSPLTDGVDKGWGEIRSEIHVFKQFAPGLKGIESFSHIIVIFEMHKSSWNADTDLVRHPQGRTGGPGSHLI